MIMDRSGTTPKFTDLVMETTSLKATDTCVDGGGWLGG